MRILVLILVVSLIVGCATTRKGFEPTPVLDSTQDTTYHSEPVTVPIFNFYPFTYPIGDVWKWMKQKLTGTSEKHP